VSHRLVAASQTRPIAGPQWEAKKLAEFISIYAVWLVAACIALESIGMPLPAEAALIAAAFYAARTHGIDIRPLIAAGIVAAILGEIFGFWIGRRFGHQLLMRYGTRLGVTEERIRVGQWLFVRYGGRFVFIARFLPFLRNIAAVLAGTNSMAQHNFYFASATAAAAWIIGYGLAAYSFGEAFANLASPAAAVLGLAATLIVLATPLLILRYERSLLAKAEREFPGHPESERQGRCGILPAGDGSHAAQQFKGAALEQGKFLRGIGAAAINVVNYPERYPGSGLEPRSEEFRCR
jgi:membrane protein DedA with SNARE-associated domain